MLKRSTCIYSLCFFGVVVLLYGTWGHSESRRESNLPYIEIKKNAYIESDDIHLGDLLITNRIDHKMESQIREVKVGETPKMGEEVVFSDRAIAEILRNEVAKKSGPHGVFLFNRIPLRIPSEIRVRRAAPILNETNFRNELSRILHNDCSECMYEFSKIRMPPLRPGFEGVDWAINLNRQQIKGSFAVRVDFREGNDIRGSEWVNGEIRIFKNVAVTERTLMIGERIQPGDIRLAKRDVTYANDSAPAEAELIGAKMKRGVRASDVISRQDVEKERVISRGETVDVTVVSDSMQVSLSGIAQDAGMVGDVIRVQNPMSKKVVTGVVVSKGKVEMR